MSTPLFNPGDTVYIKESAGVGFLEAIRITSVAMALDGQWTYTSETGVNRQTTATFGEKITYRTPTTLYYNESELLTFCEAVDVVESILSQRLDEIRALRDARC